MTAKKIAQIPNDVYALLEHPKLGNKGASDALGVSIGALIHNTIERDTTEKRIRSQSKVWPTELGEVCERKLWYERNLPLSKERIPSNNHMKFLYGDIMETVLLDLVEMSGHTVTHRQAPMKVEVDGIILSGKIDAIIDDHIMDVKVVSKAAYKKFKEGFLKEQDDFGYIPQLESYLGFSDELLSEEPEVNIIGAGFLVLNKETGNLLTYELDTTKLEARQNTEKRVQRLGKAIARTDKPETRLSTIPYGKSGNQALSMKCSYCPFKQECWADSNAGAGLRSFSYRQGPVFLTEVHDEPRVPEITHLSKKL